MTKFACALCLMIPLVALAQTNNQDSIYPDSCIVMFKKVDEFFLILEENKIQSSHPIEEGKKAFYKKLELFKTQLSTLPKNDQSAECKDLRDVLEENIKILVAFGEKVESFNHNKKSNN